MPSHTPAEKKKRQTEKKKAFPGARPPFKKKPENKDKKKR